MCVTAKLLFIVFSVEKRLRTARGLCLNICSNADIEHEIMVIERLVMAGASTP